jgi:hypothetical protein
LSHVSINTVQGIGDIFWVYQKLAPYFDTINVNILCLQPTAVQLRAESFCKMLPKVRDVTHTQVSRDAYKRVTEGMFKLSDVLNASGAVDYAVNAPLEHGVNLRDIDPETRVEEFVDLGLPPQVGRANYLCAFVSGQQHSLCWMPDKWIHAIKLLTKRLNTDRVVLVGAEWDRTVQHEIYTDLRDSYLVDSHVGNLSVADSINVIRRSRFFVGFQSGLNVIAENYDVPQLMLYYKSLEPMMYTWCKLANVRTLFNAATFQDDAATMIDSITLA